MNDVNYFDGYDKAIQDMLDIVNRADNGIDYIRFSVGDIKGKLLYLREQSDKRRKLNETDC